MFRHVFSTGLVCLFTVGGAVIATSAQAQTPLSRAKISSLRNRVNLIPASKPPRLAKISDIMVPGDSLSTARASLAELRFNDGTLARMGEQAVFRFLPKTRRFQLNNGTMLLLIPPGKGRTQVTTPNVTTGIRGSALFVRYDPLTGTSVVGALTNSGIEVTNQDGTQVQELAAGQMVVAIGNEIQGLYDFDLEAFYETSVLVKDLELDEVPPEEEADEAIAQVREETLEGLASQLIKSPAEPTDAELATVLQNPDFTAMSSLPAASISDFPLGSGSSLPPEEPSFPGRSIGVNAVPSSGVGSGVGSGAGLSGSPAPSIPAVTAEPSPALIPPLPLVESPASEPTPVSTPDPVIDPLPVLVETPAITPAPEVAPEPIWGPEPVIVETPLPDSVLDPDPSVVVETPIAAPDELIGDTPTGDTPTVDPADSVFEDPNPTFPALLPDNEPEPPILEQPILEQPILEQPIVDGPVLEQPDVLPDIQVVPETENLAPGAEDPFIDVTR